MILRKTIFIAPRIEGQVVKVSVYTDAKITSGGFVHRESNSIVLSISAYNEFIDIGSQDRMGAFVRKLPEIEQLKLPLRY